MKILNLENKNKLTIILSIGIFLIVYLINSLGFLDLANKNIQNNYYFLRTALNVGKTNNNIINDNIVVVEIDNKTLETKKDGKSIFSYPFSRDLYIPFINNLKEAGASVIAFDIIFTEDKIGDEKLKKSIKDAGNVIIGSYINDKNKFINSVFNNEILASGYFDININDGVNYGFTPYKIINNRYLDHFSFKVLKSYYRNIYNKNFIDFKSKINNGFYELFPGKFIPVAKDNDKHILINYVNRNNFVKENNVYSFVDIYDKNKFQNLLNNNISFDGKIVLLGFTADGIKDVFFTPNGQEYGVYTHANMINTILNKSYLQYFDSKIEWILIFLLIIVSVYFNLSRSGGVLIFSNISLIIIFLFIFPSSVIVFTNLIINFPVGLVTSLILSLLVSNLIKYLIENRLKKRLSQALSEYVASDIAKEVLSGSGNLNLNGEQKDLAILFSDIEGFTTISEKMDAHELVEFLREYLKEMSDIILDEKGFINKYEGDAIMALWGAFGELNDKECYFACKVALEQQIKLKKLNQIWKEKNLSEIKARIGIHFGHAILGNIGSEGRKMEFTALGDNVNLASRLEGVNKFYNTYVCVSEEVMQKTKDEFVFRYLDKIRVKGKDEPVVIYELLDYKYHFKDKDLVFDYTKAIKSYLTQDFEKSRELFKILAEKGDGPSKTYLERSEIFLKNPPTKDWDGIWSMSEK